MTRYRHTLHRCPSILITKISEWIKNWYFIQWKNEVYKFMRLHYQSNLCWKYHWVYDNGNKLLFGLELELWCVMPLLAIFQLYCGNHFYGWMKSQYPEITTDLPQIAEKMYDIMLYRVSPEGGRPGRPTQAVRHTCSGRFGIVKVLLYIRSDMYTASSTN